MYFLRFLKFPTSAENWYHRNISSEKWILSGGKRRLNADMFTSWTQCSHHDTPNTCFTNANLWKYRNISKHAIIYNVCVVCVTKICLQWVCVMREMGISGKLCTGIHWQIKKLWSVAQAVERSMLCLQQTNRRDSKMRRSSLFLPNFHILKNRRETNL